MWADAQLQSDEGDFGYVPLAFLEDASRDAVAFSDSIVQLSGPE